MKPRLLVVRSGERPFPAGAAPEIEVVERVTHRIETLHPDAAGVDGRFDFVIVTSRAAADRLSAREDLISRLSGRLIAVGPKTAERLRSLPGVKVEEGGGSADRILEALPRELSGARVLLPRGEDADRELPRELRRRGAEVVTLTLYRKAPLPYDAALDSLLTAEAFAAVTATSPAAARWLFRAASRRARQALRRTPGIALGPATRAQLAANGVQRIEVADPPTFETVARIAARLAASGGPA